MSRSPALLVLCLGALLLPLSPCSGPAAAAGTRPLVRLWGTDFRGGAATIFGSHQYGAARVNYIYAASTGAPSVMTATFTLPTVPDGPQFLHVWARLDDTNTPCPVSIELNGSVLFTGPRAFSYQQWEWRRFPLPPGLLQATNTLVVRNLSPDGPLGMPPWFMLRQCMVGPEDADVTAGPPLTDDFRVILPAEKRPLPEPLSGGHTRPGFQWRGTKGWMWRPAQYLAEIPVLAEYRMNFLMNCYTSMYDIEHYGLGDPRCNRWWEPLPREKREAYAEVVKSCQDHGIEFCFSLNPNLGSTRLVRYDSAEDLDLMWQHYAWMQRLGVRWFNVQFDDISAGIDASGQARMANALLRRLRRHDPEVQFTFCPTYYWGDGSLGREYLETLARELDPQVYVFWTGQGVVGSSITRVAADHYRAVVGHRLFIWDNYPVNDGARVMHLGPLLGRDPDLGEAADGFMANPMMRENQIGRLPLLTIADYAYNPYDYDPGRSIGQAIMHLADTPAQRQVLVDLVEMYPGMLLRGQGTGYNDLLTGFDDVLTTPHSHWRAVAMLDFAEDVAARLRSHFPDRFDDARDTLGVNIAAMRQALDTH